MGNKNDKFTVENVDQALNAANKGRENELARIASQRTKQMQQLLQQPTKRMKLNGVKQFFKNIDFVEDVLPKIVIGLAFAAVFTAGILWARADLKKLEPLMNKEFINQYNAASNRGESVLESNGVNIVGPSNESGTNKSIGGKK